VMDERMMSVVPSPIEVHRQRRGAHVLAEA
jgi:hypothetical protein